MKKEILFWNVDTQVDFVEPDGKLYVPGAEKLKPLWADIVDFAKVNDIRVVNTADFHHPDSAELSYQPDFISTFPEHCMSNTRGAEYVDETNPIDPFIVDWDKEFDAIDALMENRNIVIRKDAFDVFSGNPYTNKIVEKLQPQTVVVFGVTTNVCVNDAVIGLVKRVNRVIVLEDATKELPKIPMPFDHWKKLGVEMMTFSELTEILK